MTESLLEMKDVWVTYKTRRRTFDALRGVSAALRAGKTLGVVGESGSGKTTMGRVVLGLADASKGTATFRGDSLLGLTRSARRRLSSHIQVVFQDPYSSLNPAMAVGDILSEPLAVQGTSRARARIRVKELLDAVRLPQDSIERKPNEFSGGQRQRIAIARALALSPELIICDEPVSALDLTTQARVLDLLLEIQQETGVAYFFISHDLDVVRYMSDDVAVIRSGEIVESGTAEEVTVSPSHPYTQELLLASPIPDPDLQSARRHQRWQLREKVRTMDVEA